MADAEIKTWSVLQYNRAIARRMDEFPSVWVFGVITQLKEKGRWVYLTLGQFEENNPKPQATLDLMMGLDQFESCNKRFASLTTPFKIQVNLKMCLHLKARFYEPYGKFTPWVLAVDENFTLGELALTRQKILDALRKDGLLDRNKKLHFPDLPLRIGLITASDSAAFADFTKTLAASGYAFKVFLYEARMQGEQTEKSVVAGIARLGLLALDLICIVRGGGSKMDLVYFDSEKICRAIAMSPVPILTGIGHEIDTSLADQVAHLSRITPTACARYLVECVDESYRAVQDAYFTLVSCWRDALRFRSQELFALSSQVQRSWKPTKVREVAQLSRMVEQIHTRSRALFRAERSQFLIDMQGMRQGVRKLMQIDFGKLDSQHLLIHAIWKREKRTTAQFFEFAERQIRAMDPARLLARGFALLRNGQNKVMTSVLSIHQGDELKIELHDGTILTQVKQRIEHGS